MLRIEIECKSEDELKILRAIQWALRDYKIGGLKLLGPQLANNLLRQPDISKATYLSDLDLPLKLMMTLRAAGLERVQDVINLPRSVVLWLTHVYGGRYRLWDQREQKELCYCLEKQLAEHAFQFFPVNQYEGALKTPIDELDFPAKARNIYIERCGFAVLGELLELNVYEATYAKGLFTTGKVFEAVLAKITALGLNFHPERNLNEEYK